MRRLLACVLQGLAVCALGWGLSQPTAAQDAAKLIEYRKNVMKSLGAHTVAIAAVVKGEVGLWHQVIVHAVAIDGVNRTIVELFPPGTGPETGDTRAKPEIWQERDRFAEAARRMSAQAAALVGAALRGDRQAIAAEFASLGRTCGGCHETFRAEER